MLVYQAGKGKPIHITSYWWVLIAGEVAHSGNDCRLSSVGLMRLCACVQLCCMNWKFLAGTSRLAGSCGPALCMTAWTPRELVGWRNMVLKGQSTLFLQGKVPFTGYSVAARQIWAIRWQIHKLSFILKPGSEYRPDSSRSQFFVVIRWHCAAPSRVRGSAIAHLPKNTFF